MFIEKHYLAHRNIGKRHHIVFIAASTAVMLTIAIDLSLHKWLKYCWWNFGLVHASTFTTFTNFKDEGTISDVRSDSCQSLESLVEKMCPDFCTYIDRIELGGIFMIIFGILSLMFYLISILFHLWSFFKAQFKFKKIWVLLVLPCVFYLLGLAIYHAALNVLSIKSPDTHRFETAAPKIEVGMYLSFSIAPFTVLLTVYGLLKTRIAFLENKSM